MKKIITIAVLLLLLTIILQPGCSTPRPNFEEVIARAIEAAGEVQTYRMEESVQIVQGEMAQSINSVELVTPDRTHRISKGLQGNGSREESIQIGVVLYTRNVNSDEWYVRDVEEVMSAGRNLLGMLQPFAELGDIQELGDEMIDGVDTFHYKGSMNLKTEQQESLASLNQSDPRYEQMKRIYESIEYIRDDIEFWIGKDDYLLRQFISRLESNRFLNKGEDTEEEEHASLIVTVSFFDFNEPIEIKPPPAELVRNATLSINYSNSVGGSEDLRHQEIEYEINVSNRGTETARDVRVFVDSPATNQGLQTMEAETEHQPVDLEPGENANYLVRWEFDMSASSKVELIALLRQTLIRVTWIDETGEKHEVLQ